jgi:hypothetical protein
MEDKDRGCVIEDRRKKLEQICSSYQNKVGLGIVYNKNEVNAFLNIGLEQQKRMSAEECGEASIVLNQAAIYIQLETNKMQADISWCHRYLDFIISDDVLKLSTQYLPFEYKKVIAIKENDVAMKLNKTISDIQILIDSTQYIPSQLRSLASSFGELQQTKRQQR